MQLVEDRVFVPLVVGCHRWAPIIVLHIGSCAVWERAWGRALPSPKSPTPSEYTMNQTAPLSNAAQTHAQLNEMFRSAVRVFDGDCDQIQRAIISTFRGSPAPGRSTSQASS